MLRNEVMRKISVAELQQQCARILDELPVEGLVITKDGQPIAKLIAYHKQRGSVMDLIGCCPGIIKAPHDDLFSTGEQWDADAPRKALSRGPTPKRRK
jgi:antitoxin (DNA-binding transcriptional repressor) of toxin-antitoxin stability system